MSLLITSFIAGVLTVLAPCILPLLPITLGGAVAESENKRRPFIIITSLAVSVFVFTLLLKGTTALINVSPTFWSYISAGIIFLFGLTLLFPYAWARITLKIPGHNKPDSWMAAGYKHRGEWWADVLIGAALGPVFTTCSPTFFLILATVLPQSLSVGLVNLLAYIVGLSLALFLIAYIGQRLVNRLEWAIDPMGWFRRGLGILFILLAILIAFGLDKKIETAILDAGFFDVTKLEQGIKDSLESGQPSEQAPNQNPGVSGNTPTIPGEKDGGSFIEIVRPAGFVNSAPFKLADLVGKKVILLDFIDYSCINCQRTFPYMIDWWNKYKDQGLAIVAIHTPEFAFEKDIKNVTEAARQLGLEFPIVLDNDYATWNAYDNNSWPHKYIIDIHGRVVYDHIGEGSYANTEAEIVKQLNIRRQALGEAGAVTIGTLTMPLSIVQAASPETYFGAWRNEFFGNGLPGIAGDQTFEVPVILDPNLYYLGGKWRITREYAENLEASSVVSYVFSAAGLYMVAESKDGMAVPAQILIDGESIPSTWSGKDVTNGTVNIAASRLYRLYESKTAGRHRIDIIFAKPGARVYTFTFG